MDQLIDSKLVQLAVRLGEQLARHHFSITTAESCTGGWLAHVLTSWPDCSTWFERGFVTYSDNSKSSMLKIEKKIIKEYGPVSEKVAIAMAKGALIDSKSQVSLAITGLAGPGTDKESSVPVGTCWIAWVIKDFTSACCQRFDGDRTHINYQAIEMALFSLIHDLKKY